MAYNAMRNVVEDDYLQGFAIWLKGFLITGAIVIGLVLSNSYSAQFVSVK